MSQNPETDDFLIRAFAKLHATALGISCGILFGFGIFAVTAILLVKGGDVVGPNLRLLAQYFPGYTVTWSGSLVGAAYGLLIGFIGGWSLAFLRNLSITIYLHSIRLWTNLSADHFLDRFDN